MKAIITGGAGFLGKHLCRAVAAAGHEVTVLDLNNNPEFKTHIADVRDAKLMDELIRDADVVFHLAAFLDVAESVQFPHKYIENNVIGSLNVLESMRKNGLKNFIFSSTAAVYGEIKTLPIVEDSRTIPVNPYGASKLALEGLLSSYVESHGFTGVALRYFNLFGPEENHVPETHAIPRFITQIINDEEVTVWGKGENKRDYIYISDIVDAHILTLDLIQRVPNKYHYFNLSTEKPTSVIEAIQTIGTQLGKTPNIAYFPPRAGDPLVLYASATKAREQLGWEAKVSFVDGIKKTIDYFKTR